MSSAVRLPFGAFLDRFRGSFRPIKRSFPASRETHRDGRRTSRNTSPDGIYTDVLDTAKKRASHTIGVAAWVWLCKKSGGGTQTGGCRMRDFHKASGIRNTKCSRLISQLARLCFSVWGRTVEGNSGRLVATTRRLGGYSSDTLPSVVCILLESRPAVDLLACPSSGLQTVVFSH